MRPYDEYRQFTLNPEVMQCCLITASRRTGNASKCCELPTWKQSPLDSDHVLILNVSLTWTDKALRTQLFAKWSFVLVCPNSLIRHKSKYSIIFPYLRCNVSEWEIIIYYANNRLVLRWYRGGCANVWFTVFYFDKIPPVLVKLAMLELMCVCVCVCVCARAPTSTVSLYQQNQL